MHNPASHFIENCVLTWISDDFENLESIFRGLAIIFGEKPLPSRTDVSNAIEALIKRGEALAYDLEAGEQGKPAQFCLDKLDYLWYYATPDGKEHAIAVPKLQSILKSR